jgi:hypothetical protein
MGRDAIPDRGCDVHRWIISSVVMAGLVPAIHVLLFWPAR